MPPLRHHRRLRVEQLEPRVLLNASGSLRGTVFDDLDGDGVFDQGEPGLPGVEVELKRVGDVARTFNTFGPDRQSVAIRGNRYLIGEPERSVVRLFDLPTGDILHTFSDPNPEIHGLFGQAVAFVGDNVLIGSPFRAPGFSDGPVENQPFAHLFDGTTGALLQSFHDPWGLDQDHFLSVAGNENRILIGDSMDDAAYLFDATSGELLRRFSVSRSEAGGFAESVAFVGDHLLIGASKALYLFDGGTGEQLRSFTTPDATEHFGRQLAVSGTRILASAWTVGSPAATTYLFDGETGALIQTFENPDPASDVTFGASLAFFNEYVLIGSPGRATAGAAQLFDAGSGELIDTFQGPAPSRRDGFGSSIAADSDFFLVGATGYGTGQVHLFNPTGSIRIDSGVSVTTNARGEYGFNAVPLDNYVVSVVVPEGYAQSLPSGDGAHVTIRNLFPYSPGNGTRTVATDDGAYVISVQRDDILLGLDFGAVNDIPIPAPVPPPVPEDGTASGTVFDDLNGDGVFDPGEPGLPGLEVRLERLAGHLRTFESGAMDGNSVAIRGNRYLIGMPGNGGPGAQIVRLFDLATGDVLHTFSNPNPELHGDFGQAVAFVGNDVLVAAPYFPWLDGGHTQVLADQPFAYLFDGATGSLLQSFRDPYPGDYGRRMSLVSDDSRVLIGDSRDGAAYLFDPTSGELLQRFSVPNGTRWSFGASVAFVGDHVLVRAGNALYLFDGDTGKARRSFAGPDATRRMGTALAVSGSKILACGRASDGTESTVYLFEATTGDLLQAFTSPDPTSDDRFGGSVAFFGDQVLIGAPGRRAPGTVYLFDASTGELLDTYESPSSRLSRQRGFGRCMATDGSHFLVGAGGYGSDLVHLFSSAGSTVADTITATTDTEGRYRFEDVAPGIYTVSAILPEGRSQTVPDDHGTYVISITDGEQPADLDFGAVTSAPPPAPQPPLVLDPPPAPQPPLVLDPPPVLIPPVEPGPISVPDPPSRPDPPSAPNPPSMSDPPPIRDPEPVPEPLPAPDPPSAPNPPSVPDPPPIRDPEPALEPLPVPDPPSVSDPPPVSRLVPTPEPIPTPTPPLPPTVSDSFEFSDVVVHAVLEGDYRILEDDGRFHDPLTHPSKFAPHVLDTALYHADQYLDTPSIGFSLGSSVHVDALSTNVVSSESERRRALRFDLALSDWSPEMSLPLEVEIPPTVSDPLFELAPGEWRFDFL